MPGLNDGFDAIERRLQAMPGRPVIAYQASPKLTETLPRMVIQRPRPPKRTIFLQGTTECEVELIVRIETKQDLGVDAAAIFAAIEAQFPVGLEFEGMTVNDAPETLNRYSSGGVFHVPVSIKARFYY